MKRIYFTVTNDLTYDQRMHRICTSLAENGYVVTLVGRKLPSSLPLAEKKFAQKRIRCWFNKTKWFYAEYNIRLFFFLLFKKMDAICAIDLDTILPCLRISRWKRIPRIYDAHELFTELKEVISRPAIQKVWTRIERRAVPKFKHGYTVSESIAQEFKRRYKVDYKTIRNVPVLQPLTNDKQTERFILYQGAVNEARGLEYLIPAMQWVNSKLVICGDGNFMEQLKKLVSDYKLEEKVELQGMLSPDKLREISQKAFIGVAVPEKEGLNQYLALPNKLFDYIHAGLPQVTVNYPEYRKINSQFEVAVLLDDISPKRIAEALNNLLMDDVLYKRLKENCLKARELLNWQQEEKKLISFYHTILNS
ncbi:MAG: glycosyltransferase [Bacteroidota bacterium]|nr:glycosyltransferase [Bacteroidota bacterium]